MEMEFGDYIFTEFGCEDEEEKRLYFQNLREVSLVSDGRQLVERIKDFGKRKLKVLVTQLCPILCNPMNRSPPGSSVHGISRASILKWVVISFSRSSSQLRG